MPEKLQTFLINVAIIEGRHYIWPNMNSTVSIKIDNQKKSTAVKFNTDCPYYNEYFVFEFSSTLEKIMDKNITVTVIKPGSILRKRKILGFITLDVGTVWYQKDHIFYHKWAILTAPTKEFVGGTRGYLKLDVSVLSKGEAPKIPKSSQTASDEIEGHLLLPEGNTTERQRVYFIFDVYRGLDFVKKNLIQEGGSKKPDGPPSSLIEISFSGLKVSTSTQKGFSPTWNERLFLSELFPPLCQRFKIELHHSDSYRRAIRYVHIRSISNDKDEGFLPTFGPTFLHFYSPNHLEGYLGKILLSLNTELLGNVLDNSTKSDLSAQKAPLINEETLLRYEDIILFATIFEVSSINRKYSDKAISFRMACGSFQKEMDENGDKSMMAVTTPMKPKITNKNHCFLSFEENKPCLHLSLILPDTRNRMYNYNLLAKILNDLKCRLDKIEDIFNNKDYKIANEETETLLLETLEFISSAGSKYIDIASNTNFEQDPILDQQRLRMSIKEMEIIRMVAKTIPTLKGKKHVFQKIEKLYSRIEALIDDVEDWPRIYFWMIYGNKRVAYHMIEAKDIIYSLVEEEKGVQCGVLQTVYFQSEDNQNAAEFISMACKMDVIMWMGLARHWNRCIENLPGGFVVSETIPKVLVAEEKYDFQCRAHVFQGRFTPGSDKSGLCDPYAQVHIDGQFRQTQILKKTLNPVWDETLTFKQITLYGSKSFILGNPPIVLVEVYDKDEWSKFEVVGKCIIKPIVKSLEEPYCPPRLTWCPIYNKFDVSSEILVAVELLELSENSDGNDRSEAIVRIPPDIKPNLVNHRVEVVFWGVRNLKKVQVMQLNKPKIVIESVNMSLSSGTLVNARKNLNFANPVKIFEVVFPEQHEYAPPISLKMFDCRNFGINVFAGTHVVPMSGFFYSPKTAQEREQKLTAAEADERSDDVSQSIDTIISKLTAQTSPPKPESPEKKARLKKVCKLICCKGFAEAPSVTLNSVQPTVEDEDLDWWTKFNASLEETPNQGVLLSHKHKLKIYQNELELQPEFEGFTDMLRFFPMYKGKRTGDETVDEENTTGVFKGSLKIYRWGPAKDFVTASGGPLDQGVFQDFPSNNPLRFVLRVYCVRALGLRPKDLNGTSDPYLRLILNDQVVNDKDNRIMRQVNPVFGRCFEFNGVFPQDHSLTIYVYDWDAASADDLIGETKIDLENRFYTRHRGHCGLAEIFENSGYCQWRDQQKPTSILDGLCKKYSIPEPEYGATSVRVACKEFQPRNLTPSDDANFDRQVLALAALHRWPEVPVVGCALVPEHVETRSLYNPNKPGIEQGKLQLWIDILPCADLPTPKQVNIAPRKPEPYELRVIIWNAEKIKMNEDDFFTGERKSDIYIKGWLTGPDKSQYTDVHYRSLSGEANFNWRFIFPFEYLSTENKTVVTQQSLFGFDEVVNKIPCRLTLQSWDNDTFSKNDFLGVLTLELSKLPRGAQNSKACSLSFLKANVPALNLFKVRRTKGWWPLKSIDHITQDDIFVGAVEVEFELLTKEDAEKCPAGVGRDDPQALSKPNRPDTSFNWFRNPWKAFKYIVMLQKWKILKALVFAMLIMFLFAAYYAFPGYSVKRILGA